MRSIRLLLAMGLAASPASAQLVVPELTPEQEAVAREAMSSLRSPVTPFHTVDMCPSVGALRDTIRVAAANGEGAQQIIEGVIARYGEDVRLLPRRTGVGLLAWIGTPLVVLGGMLLIAARLRKGQRAVALAPAAAPISDAEREKLQAALGELDRLEELE